MRQSYILAGLIVLGLIVALRLLHHPSTTPTTSGVVVDLNPALYRYPRVSSIKVAQIPLSSRLWGTGL